ncbi:MAG: MerR family transcriptional regulator [Rickettsiales bacterium]
MASTDTTLFAYGENDKKTEKAPNALRTISEASELLDVPQHVLRFWETKFPQIKPLKRNGGRRFYRPQDLDVLQQIKHLLYAQGYTIKGAKKAVDDFLNARGDGNVTSAEWIAQTPPASVNDNTAPEPDMLAEIAAALSDETLDQPATVPNFDRESLTQLRAELVSLRDGLRLQVAPTALAQ